MTSPKKFRFFSETGIDTVTLITYNKRKTKGGFMENKHIRIKEYLLNLLESGQLKAGDRLPGARRLTKESGVSYTHIQTVIETLVQNGIFETVPRSGTFVQQGWQSRILPATFACNILPWIDKLDEIIRKDLPQIHVCRKFTKGIFEFRVTHYLFSHHDEYLDLMPLFKECFPDEENYFLKLLNPFIVDGKLCGIPWIFSPRILLYNRRLFREAGCPIPHDNWSWDDFLTTVDLLKRKIAPGQIIDWQQSLHYWINLVVRSGGSLFEPAAEDPVKIDSPETIRGLRLYAELRERLFPDGSAGLPQDVFENEFAAGRAAMAFAPRQYLYKLKLHPSAQELELAGVSIPTPEGGRRASMLAADLFCIRKNCTDMRLGRECAKLLFSEAVQDYFGKTGYGIPFRRSSAQKALKLDDELDVKFLTEIPQMVYDYNIFSPELYALVTDGVGALCLLPSEKIAEEAHRLADAIRIFLRIKRSRKLQTA